MNETASLLAGDLRIYSAPKALLRHIQWSLNQILGYPAELSWEEQHLSAGCFATQYQDAVNNYNKIKLINKSVIILSKYKLSKTGLKTIKKL